MLNNNEHLIEKSGIFLLFVLLEKNYLVGNSHKLILKWMKGLIVNVNVKGDYYYFFLLILNC